MRKTYYIPTIEVIRVDFPIWMAIGDSNDHDYGIGGGDHAPARRDPGDMRSY